MRKTRKLCLLIISMCSLVVIKSMVIAYNNNFPKEVIATHKDTEVSPQYLVGLEVESVVVEPEVYTYHKATGYPNFTSITETTEFQKIYHSYQLNSITYSFTEEQWKEVEMIARITKSEAGNQTYEGKLGVGNVVINRTMSDKSYFKDSIYETITQPNQFSSYNNKYYLSDIDEECLKASVQNYLGFREFPTNVVFFKSVNCTAKWDYPVYSVIDGHIFYTG